MKYSFKLKKEIYEKHCEGYGSDYLSQKYGMDASQIRYMCRLIDKHGLDAIRHKFTKPSPEYKLAAINRVLEDGESIKSVAVDIGLTNDGILHRWIKSYIENGYNVVTKKKGRPSKLREQLLRKTIEVELLKKLQALAQEEEKKKKSN